MRDGDRHAGADPCNEPAHDSVVEPEATVGDGGARNATDVVETVQRDLAWPAVEFLEHLGAGAQGER